VAGEYNTELSPFVEFSLGFTQSQMQAQQTEFSSRPLTATGFASFRWKWSTAGTGKLERTGQHKRWNVRASAALPYWQWQIDICSILSPAPHCIRASTVEIKVSVR